GLSHLIASNPAILPPVRRQATKLTVPLGRRRDESLSPVGVVAVCWSAGGCGPFSFRAKRWGLEVRRCVKDIPDATTSPALAASQPLGASVAKPLRRAPQRGGRRTGGCCAGGPGPPDGLIGCGGAGVGGACCAGAGGAGHCQRGQQTGDRL